MQRYRGVGHMPGTYHGRMQSEQTTRKPSRRAPGLMFKKRCMQWPGTLRYKPRGRYRMTVPRPTNAVQPHAISLDARAYKCGQTPAISTLSSPES